MVCRYHGRYDDRCNDEDPPDRQICSHHQGRRSKAGERTSNVAKEAAKDIAHDE